MVIWPRGKQYLKIGSAIQCLILVFLKRECSSIENKLEIHIKLEYISEKLSNGFDYNDSYLEAM